MRTVFICGRLITGGLAAWMIWRGSLALAADTNAPALGADLLSRPLALVDCLNLALTQNSGILKSQHDLEATHGVIIQTRAIVLPKLQASGAYKHIDEGLIELPNLPGNFKDAFSRPLDSWNAGLQVYQSVYEGGRMISALRTARLLKDQAILNHQAAIADVLLAVRVSYTDVLSASNQIQVQEASVELLRKELNDTRSRYEAGTVPRFNFLRAGVEVTNAIPRLIRARNAYRIAKNNLATLIGYNLPKDTPQDIPLQLTDALSYAPYQIELSEAVVQAFDRRPELRSLRKFEQIRKEAITTARAGYRPSVQVFGGYTGQSSSFDKDLTVAVNGWTVGAQASWNIFDGLYTKGKVDEAKALHQKAREEIIEITRRIELEVRTSYSTFQEAKEVLDAQQNVNALAEEALRLAQARNEAGTGTQLDVLNAQTSLTEARTTHFQALRDYVVAQARLERAVGLDIAQQMTAK